jgi:hypothetical protein
VLEGEKLYLLPMQGSGTQWYKNVLQNPSIWIDAQGAAAEVSGMSITEPKAVKSVVEKFREKYGAKDVKKYYSKFDVAWWPNRADSLPSNQAATAMRCYFAASYLSTKDSRGTARCQRVGCAGTD